MDNLLSFTNNLSKENARKILEEEIYETFGENPDKIKYLALMGESISLESNLYQKYGSKIHFTNVERDKEIRYKLLKIANQSKIPLTSQATDIDLFFKNNSKSSFPLKYDVLWLDWVGGFCPAYWRTLDNILKSSISLKNKKALIAITVQAARDGDDHLAKTKPKEMNLNYLRYYARPAHLGVKARAFGYTLKPKTYYSYQNEKSINMIMYVFEITQKRMNESINYADVNMKKFTAKRKDLGLIQTFIPEINAPDIFKESNEYLEWKKENFIIEKIAL